MIEILVVRDPDGYDEIRVWLDGVEITDDDQCVVVKVDAGAGWDHEDWLESATAHQERMTYPAAQAALAAAYADPPGKKYIDGWPEEDL